MLNAIQRVPHFFRVTGLTIASHCAVSWVELRARLRNRFPAWPPRLSALVFHDIPPEREGLFRMQLEMLRDHFAVIDMPAFGALLHNKVPTQKDAVLLTFDDAYRSHARVARILSEYGFKGLFFVPAEFPGSSDDAVKQSYIYQHLFSGYFPPKTLPPHLDLLGWEDLKEIARAGHHIGCHTRWHAPLRTLDTTEKLRDELIRSGDILEQQLGCAIESFAAPFGTVESLGAEALSLLPTRYKYIFTSVRGDNGNGSPQALFRETVTVDDSPEYVLLQACGGLGWAYYGARRRLEKLRRRNARNGAN
jgi:peptidoglycan/xylan/chitin deacetylase (PgdA/CDA1 family)